MSRGRDFKERCMWDLSNTLHIRTPVIHCTLQHTATHQWRLESQGRNFKERYGGRFECAIRIRFNREFKVLGTVCEDHTRACVDSHQSLAGAGLIRMCATRVAGSCRVLQCVAVCCSMIKRVAVSYTAGAGLFHVCAITYMTCTLQVTTTILALSLPLYLSLSLSLSLPLCMYLCII